MSRGRQSRLMQPFSMSLTHTPPIFPFLNVRVFILMIVKCEPHCRITGKNKPTNKQKSKQIKSWKAKGTKKLSL